MVFLNLDLLIQIFWKKKKKKLKVFFNRKFQKMFVKRTDHLLAVTSAEQFYRLKNFNPTKFPLSRNLIVKRNKFITDIIIPLSLLNMLLVVATVISRRMIPNTTTAVMKAPVASNFSLPSATTHSVFTPK